MNEKPITADRHYRIGEFAEKLGVTTDFLKYCEKKGFLTPRVEPNGYRYYEFSQSATVIEYLKLKNQGFTAAEIEHLLRKCSFEANIEDMLARRAQIEREITFHQELLHYYERLSEFPGYFTDPPTWFIRPSEAFYFLPHSHGRNFREDDTLPERIHDWNMFLPLVASACRLNEGEENTEKVEWGYAVTQSIAEKLGICVDAPVQKVEGGKCLEIYLHGALSETVQTKQPLIHSILEKQQLTQCGEIYEFVIFKMWKENIRHGYSLIRIPVK